MAQVLEEHAQAAIMKTDNEEFSRLAEPFRRELLAHCYRMLGSVHDAEDVVQETYLRAWRAFPNFEGRSSLRVWLYRIATSASISALDHRSRRVLPSGLGAPGDDPSRPAVPAGPEIQWIQPLPQSGYVAPSDPAAVVAMRDSVRLALVAALQHLPPKQRAVLIMRDVLSWRAAEVAELLDTTPQAVNSALQRARSQLERAGVTEEDLAVPDEPTDRALVDQYAEAFENADIDALVRLLRDDVALEMPPNLTWFHGREAVGQFLAGIVIPRLGATRSVPTTANGQPALAVYAIEDDGAYHAHAVQVFTTTPTGISRIVSFNDASLFALFDLPSRLDPSEG